MVVNGEDTPLSCNQRRYIGITVLFMTSSCQCGRTTCTRVGYEAHKNQSIADHSNILPHQDRTDLRREMGAACTRTLSPDSQNQ